MVFTPKDNDKNKSEDETIEKGKLVRRSTPSGVRLSTSEERKDRADVGDIESGVQPPPHSDRMDSLDAASIPVPTELQRHVPLPGAYRHAGPRARDGDNESIHSTDSSQHSSPPTDTYIVTAQLVEEDLEQATQSPKPLVYAEPIFNEDEDSTKIKPKLWTRRNLVIAAAVTVVILALLIVGVKNIKQATRPTAIVQDGESGEDGSTDDD
jgi:hypothetical protein